jgi:hypothetical protein
VKKQKGDVQKVQENTEKARRGKKSMEQNKPKNFVNCTMPKLANAQPTGEVELVEDMGESKSCPNLKRFNVRVAVQKKGYSCITSMKTQKIIDLKTCEYCAIPVITNCIILATSTKDFINEVQR